jgi:hypothetical protein
MKIIPSLTTVFLLFTTSLPLVSNIRGFGVNSYPVNIKNTQVNCPNDKKDKYGRCPNTSTRSNFRYLSVGGTSRTGGGGGAK